MRIDLFLLMYYNITIIGGMAEGWNVVPTGLLNRGFPMLRIIASDGDNSHKVKPRILMTHDV